MAAKRESNEARSARLLRQGADLAVKSDRDFCFDCMRAHGASIRHVKKVLVDLGYADASGCIAPASQSAAGTDGAPTARVNSAYNNLRGKAHAPDFDPAQPLSEAWQTLGKTSAEFLQWLLREAEPVAFSSHAMKGAIKASQRKLPKALLFD